MIEVKKLCKSYGEKAVLKELSFNVNRGEFFGLLGDNGAGKSTTIDCMLGLKKYENGRIKIFDKNPNQLNRSDYNKMGVQFQQSHYQDKIKVEELCILVSAYYLNPVDYKGLLKEYGLEDKKTFFVEKLSGGEKQCLAVLLTLISNPKLVFLDELTTGLDTLSRRKVWNSLKKMKKTGLTVVLTSHYMDEVEVLCDRVAIIVEGSSVFEGSIQQALEESKQNTLEDAYLWYTGGMKNEVI